MTRSERLKRARAFHQAQRQQERAAVTQLRQELDRATEAAARAYPAWKATLKSHQSRLQPIVLRIALRGLAAGVVLGRDAAAKGIAAPEHKRGPTEPELSRRIRDWAKRHAAERVANIAATTRRRINTVIAAGLQADDHPATIARNIRDVVQSMNRRRAETIARTETAQAMMVGQDEGVTALADDLGLKVWKTWTATHDERTRETHFAADGQTVENDDVFIVGGVELRFPSDPNGPPEEVINCRCVPIYEAR